MHSLHHNVVGRFESGEGKTFVFEQVCVGVDNAKEGGKLHWLTHLVGALG